jgi:enamine deaminase RidA (YjgF/YER057c/UK114 family)
MSAVTVFNQVVYLSGQVPKNTEQDVAGQTREILATIDELLALPIPINLACSLHSSI